MDRTMKRLLKLSLLLLCNTCILAQQKAVIRIDSGSVKNTVAPTLHGVFFEEISHGGDGGLYAEMVRNRGFEDNRLPPGTHLENGNIFPRRTPHYNLAGKPTDWTMPWTLTTEWPGWRLAGDTAAIRVRLTKAHPLNSASPQSMEISVSGSQAANPPQLVNEGYWGMGVSKGKNYHLSFYARDAGNYRGTLELALLDRSGNALATSQVTLKPGRQWQQYKLRLEAFSGEDSAQLAFRFRGKGKLWLDFVSLFPEETYKNRANGLRADLASYIAGLQPSFLRWPGGCFVEGINVESAPNWKRTIGPVEQRPGTFSVWDYWSTDGFGYHEYLQFCEDIGADALYVFNAGVSCEFRSGTFVPDDSLQPVIDNVLDAIEYAVGPVTTTYGKMRAANGHPKPFPLRYVEVGNEQHGPWYAKRYNRFHEAIRKQYPDIKIISSMGIGDINRWTLDSIRTTDIADEHAYKAANWSFINYNHFDGYKRGDYDVYVGEYATNAGVGQGNMLAALNDAVYIMGMENNGDLVKMSSYAPLLENVNSRHWPVNLIRFNSAKSFARISYYAIKLFQENRADENFVVQQSIIPLDGAYPNFSGGIGLATWDTQTEYKDLEIIANGKQVYRSDFLARPDEWKVVSGQWQVNGDAWQQSGNGAHLLSLLKDLSLEEYTLRLKGRKLSGYNAFIIPFAVTDERNHLRAHIGSYVNKNSVFEQVINGSVSNIGKYVPLRQPIETGKWYNIRLEVGRNQVMVFLEDSLLMSHRHTEKLVSIAGRDRETGDLILKVVNGDDHPYDVEIQVAGGFRKHSQVRVYEIRAGRNEENSFAHPEKILPSLTELTTTEPSLKRRFPANSITVLRIR